MHPAQDPKYSQLLAFVSIFFLSSPAAVAGEALQVTAGEYAIESNMTMPHLEEMRRIVARETRCVGAQDVRALFPVMRQPALNGCRFDFPEQAADAVQYVLACESARVATGTLALQARPPKLIGHLEVKMGGKNMTFSQRVVATRQGPCPTVQ
jgi:hypothetical protein